MIRVLNERLIENGKKLVELAGLSTDSKPTTGIITGSKYTCADTGDVYMFYEADSPGWGKIIAGPTVSAGS